MEKAQEERLIRIARRAILAAGAIALYTHKDEILGHARAYPGGTYIVEALNDVRERSVRMAGNILHRTETEVEVDIADGLELSDEQIDMLDEMFSDQRIQER